MKVWYYQSEAQESRRLTMKETAAVFMDCLASLVASVSSTTYAITQMQLLLGEDTTKEVGKTP